MAFRIVKVIDGETIQVKPNWEWTTPNGKRLVGDTLKISGYTIQSDKHKNYAINKLLMLLADKELVLKNPKILSNNDTEIACSVFVNDIDVSYYFPEYKQSV